MLPKRYVSLIYERGDGMKICLIVLNIIVLTVIVTVGFIKRNYGLRLLSPKEKKPGMGMAVWIEDRLQLSKRIGGRKFWEMMDRVSGHDNPDHAVKIYYCKKIWTCLMIFVITNAMCCTVCVFAMFDSSESDIAKRPEYGDGDKEVSATVKIGNGPKEEITYKISERVPTAYEGIKEFEETKKYIDDNFLGENESANCVNKQLNLMEEHNGVTIEWVTDEDGYINGLGQIEPIFDKDGIVVEITAMLSYLDKEEDYVIPLRIMPPDEELSSGEKLQNQISKKDKENINDSVVDLPTEIDGKKVEYIQKSGNEGVGIILLGILAAALIFILGDKSIKDKDEERREQMLLDFPEIMSKFCMLLKAGMTIKGAWEKIALDYQRHGEKRYAYDEMVFTMNEMSNGISQIKAYENYGIRCGMLQYGKFSTWIIQQGKKGAQGLVQLLEVEMYEAKEERNKTIKIMGEKISTKMLFPMVGLMAVVMLIVIVPAFYSIL